MRGQLNLQGVSLAQMNRLNVSVIAEGENTPTFGFTIGDFIASYNGLYYDDHFDFELPQLSEWEHSTGAGANGICEVYAYRFIGDGQLWSLPTMTIRTSLGSAHVLKLTLDFDDHGYTDSL